MNAMSLRFHQLEHNLTSAADWVEHSPLPSRLFKITSLFFGSVAIASLVPLHITATISVAVVSGALAIATYAISRFLHHKRNTLFEDVDGLANLYVQSKNIVRESPEAQKLLKAYWSEEHLYTVLYNPNASDLDRWAYSMIPNTLQHLIHDKKKNVELRAEELKKTSQESIDEINLQLKEKREIYARTLLARSILYQLSANISNTIAETESEILKGAYDDCKAAADFNAEAQENELLLTNAQIKILEEQREPLLKTLRRTEKEIETLRRNVCKDAFALINRD